MTRLSPEKVKVVKGVFPVQKNAQSSSIPIQKKGGSSGISVQKNLGSSNISLQKRGGSSGISIKKNFHLAVKGTKMSHGRMQGASKRFGEANNQCPTGVEESEKISTVDEVEETSGSTTSIMKERFNSVMKQKDDNRNQSQTLNTRIQKVPFMLRGIKDSKKYFEPMVVSIGPYHHGKVELETAEMIKLKLTYGFVSVSENSIEDLYAKIFKEIEKLKKCYDKDPTGKYDDDELAWMLFLDGCSILHYIHCYVNTYGSLLKDFNIKDHHVAFIDQDLFLMENQLPFLVLELLMSMSPIFKDKVGMETIEKFIERKIVTQRNKKRKQQQQKEEQQQKQQQQQEQQLQQQQQEEQQQEQQVQQHQQEGQQQPSPPLPSQDTKAKHSHLLDLLRKRLIGNGKKKTDSIEDTWHSFRSVTELTAAGIHLKPSGTDYLTDVSFESHRIGSADLKLPPIAVDDSTRPKFLNLIAYEMSPGVNSQLEVTSYICFLDSLIDHPEDVKQLRAAHIVHNFLGSDEEVAELFNEISTDLVPNNELYKDVKAKIQEHYDSKVKCWMAQFIHDRFSSPWSLLAFIGALLALLLTFVQTYFAISPLPSNCDGLCDYLKKRYI